MRSISRGERVAVSSRNRSSKPSPIDPSQPSSRLPPRFPLKMARRRWTLSHPCSLGVMKTRMPQWRAHLTFHVARLAPFSSPLQEATADQADSQGVSAFILHAVLCPAAQQRRERGPLSPTSSRSVPSLVLLHRAASPNVPPLRMPRELSASAGVCPLAESLDSPIPQITHS
jgi:hypothetical protein